MALFFPFKVNFLFRVPLPGHHMSVCYENDLWRRLLGGGINGKSVLV